MKGKKKEGRMHMVWDLPAFRSERTSVSSTKPVRETRRGKCRGTVSRIRKSTPIKEVGLKEKNCVYALSFLCALCRKCELSFKVPYP
jgi:hypothetical protein